MALLIPNLKVKFRDYHGTDLYGQTTEYSAFRDIKVGLVHIKLNQKSTSVRADSSGSQGRAAENTSDAVLLFPNTIMVMTGDQVKYKDTLLEVVGIEPRYNLRGDLDHNEVTLEIKAS